MLPYVVFTLAWIAWCFLHSWLISPIVSAHVQRRLQHRYRFFRIFYNLIAILTLIPVVLYGFSLAGPQVWRWEGPLRIVQGLLLIASLALFMAGARRYDLLQFLGVRQIREKTTCGTLTDDCRLDASGVLGFVRHPWYTGGIMIVWARNLDMASFLTNLVLTGYFIIGALLEEKKLLNEFGQEYAEYQKQVSMFFPTKWLKDFLFNRPR